MEIDQEVAAYNGRLLYVPGATILSLDDYYLRIASRAVTTLTCLQQYKNPKKGLGPVGNELCSALNPVFFGYHFTIEGKKLLHVWQHLIQLLQGTATMGSFLRMTDAIIAPTEDIIPMRCWCFSLKFQVLPFRKANLGRRLIWDTVNMHTLPSAYDRPILFPAKSKCLLHNCLTQ